MFTFATICYGSCHANYSSGKCVERAKVLLQLKKETFYLCLCFFQKLYSLTLIVCNLNEFIDHKSSIIYQSQRTKVVRCEITCFDLGNHVICGHQFKIHSYVILEVSATQWNDCHVDHFTSRVNMRFFTGLYALYVRE